MKTCDVLGESRHTLTLLHIFRGSGPLTPYDLRPWLTEFSAYTEENKANFPLPLDVQKVKAFQLQGGFAPDPLTRGSAPRPSWGLCPQTPVIGSCSRARHGNSVPITLDLPLHHCLTVAVLIQSIRFTLSADLIRRC